MIKLSELGLRLIVVQGIQLLTHALSRTSWAVMIVCRSANVRLRFQQSKNTHLIIIQIILGEAVWE